MKIALVIAEGDRTRGGAERYTLDLAQELGQRGNEVWLLATQLGAISPPLSGVTIEARSLTRTGRYLRFISRLERHLGEAHYDIVHAMLPVWQCDIYHPHAGLALENLRHAHRTHSSAVRRWVARAANRLNVKRNAMALVERRLLGARNTPVVLCLSEAQKRLAAALYPNVSSQTLFNAIDLERFDPGKRPEARQQIRDRLNIAPDAVLVVLMAHNWALKGVRQAIAALARVNDQRLVLAVVGRDDPRPYQAVARRLGVESQVRYPGPTADAFAFYRAADFLVHPTSFDVCSLVVLEALAMGLPVISTRANGACEIMTSGREGFVLDEASDEQGLADAMAKLLEESHRCAASAAALELRAKLSFERHVTQLLEVYQSISDAKRQSPRARAPEGTPARELQAGRRSW